MKVLVTGGAGYIGSVTATALEQAGHTPIIVNSLIGGPEAYVGAAVPRQAPVTVPASRAVKCRLAAHVRLGAYPIAASGSHDGSPAGLKAKVSAAPTGWSLADSEVILSRVPASTRACEQPSEHLQSFSLPSCQRHIELA